MEYNEPTKCRVLISKLGFCILLVSGVGRCFSIEGLLFFKDSENMIQTSWLEPNIRGAPPEIRGGGGLVPPFLRHCWL